MIGRIDEMEELLSTFGSMVKGQGSLVIVSGEVGMGKTRLVQELLDYAGKMDVLTYKTKCRAEAPSSLQPFTEICSQIGQDEEIEKDLRSQSMRVMNEIIGSLSSNQERRTNVQSIDIVKIELLFRSLLTNISKKKPLVIFIDDLQWVDSPTVNMIHALSRDIRSHRIMIIGAIRDGDPVANEDQRIVIEEGMKLLRREGLVKSLILSRFDYDDLRELIESRLHGRVDLNLLSAIGEKSRGIPLLAVEYTQMILEDGDLIERKGMWCLKEDTILNLPPKIFDVIDRRMEHLTDEDLELLKVFAVIGEPIDVPTLEIIFGDGHEDSIIKIGYLCERYDLLIEDRNRFYIKHDLIVRAINERMDVEERKSINLSIGTMLEHATSFQFRFDLLSMLFCKADDDEKCVFYSSEAGRRCLEYQDYRSGLTYLNKVLIHSVQKERYKKSKLFALEGLGDCYRELSNHNLARRYYKEIIDEDIDDNTRARTYRKLAECCFPYEKDDPSWKDRMEYVERALFLIKDDDLEKAEILSTTAVLLDWDLRHPEAEKRFEESEMLFKKCNENGRLAITLAVHANHFMEIGDFNSALLKIDAAKEALGSIENRRAKIELSLCYCELFYVMGKYVDARREIKKIIDLALNLEDYRCVSYLFFYSAMMNIDDFELKNAYGDSVQSLDYMTILTDDEYGLIVPKTAMSLILILLDRIDEADNIINELDEISSKLPSDLDSYFPGLILMISGLLRRKRGDHHYSMQIKKGIERLQNKRLGVFFQALGYEWMGALQIEERSFHDARSNLDVAMNMMNKIGNKYHIEKISRLILSINAPLSNDERGGQNALR